jgi:hypothetical protein
MEIMFTDLTEDAQKRLLEASGIKDPKDMNWDVFPVTYVLTDEDEKVGEA